jgi:Flp pilus assembly protein protease CpaA
MNSSDKPWPPLIVVGHVPRLVKWRDLLLTSILWVCFALLLGIEFELFVGGSLGLLDIDWPLFYERLKPFFLTAAVLAGLLVISGLLTLRRRERSLLLPQPAPLEAADQARRAGLDEAALIAARDRGIVIVHIDADNRHRIEEPHRE